MPRKTIFTDFWHWAGMVVLLALDEGKVSTVESLIAVCSLLVVVQGTIFVLSSNTGESILVGYVKAWEKTFRFVGAMFVVGNKQGRKLSIIAWVVFLLCIPGFFLVCQALAGMRLFS